jgi:hypothetical protein
MHEVVVDRGLQLIDGAAMRGVTLLNEMRFRQREGVGSLHAAIWLPTITDF